MGTNFFKKPQLTKERKKRLHDLIEQEKFYSDYLEETDPTASVDAMIKWLTEGVHICKRSAGWRILFDHNNGKYYQPTKKSLIEFLEEPDSIIVDEYGNSYTTQEFWQMISDWESNPNLWTDETYNKAHPQTALYNFDHGQDLVKKLFGINTITSDFISVDNLRFATFTDFR